MTTQNNQEVMMIHFIATKKEVEDLIRFTELMVGLSEQPRSGAWGDDGEQVRAYQCFHCGESRSAWESHEIEHRAACPVRGAMVQIERLKAVLGRF